MTEQEWLTCGDPSPMQGFLGPDFSLRKRRLFVLACCRELWGTASDKATLTALAVAKRIVETGAPQASKITIQVSSGQAVIDCGASEPLAPLEIPGQDGSPKRIDLSAVNPPLAYALELIACWRSTDWWPGWLIDSFDRTGLSRSRQAMLLREIVRGPFHPLILRAAWRTQNAAVAMEIAKGIYHDEMFEDLPVLADALEDAACDAPDLLSHLRCGGPHTLGCWALDSVLGKF
jgi:hypothetical protein